MSAIKVVLTENYVALLFLTIGGRLSTQFIRQWEAIEADWSSRNVLFCDGNTTTGNCLDKYPLAKYPLTVSHLLKQLLFIICMLKLCSHLYISLNYIYSLPLTPYALFWVFAVNEHIRHTSVGFFLLEKHWGEAEAKNFGYSIKNNYETQNKMKSPLEWPGFHTSKSPWPKYIQCLVGCFRCEECWEKKKKKKKPFPTEHQWSFWFFYLSFLFPPHSLTPPLFACMLELRPLLPALIKKNKKKQALIDYQHLLYPSSSSL